MARSYRKLAHRWLRYLVSYLKRRIFKYNFSIHAIVRVITHIDKRQQIRLFDFVSDRYFESSRLNDAMSPEIFRVRSNEFRKSVFIRQHQWENNGIISGLYKLEVQQ